MASFYGLWSSGALAHTRSRVAAAPAWRTLKWWLPGGCVLWRWFLGGRMVPGCIRNNLEGTSSVPVVMYHAKLKDHSKTARSNKKCTNARLLIRMPLATSIKRQAHENVCASRFNHAPISLSAFPQVRHLRRSFMQARPYSDTNCECEKRFTSPVSSCLSEDPGNRKTSPWKCLCKPLQPCSYQPSLKSDI